MKGYKGMDDLSKLKGIVNVWRYCQGMTGLSRYEELVRGPNKHFMRHFYDFQTVCIRREIATLCHHFFRLMF